MRVKTYRADVAAWEEAVLKLRLKYTDTPPGLTDQNRIRQEREKITELHQEALREMTPGLENEKVVFDETFAGREKELAAIAAYFAEESGPVVSVRRF